MLIFPFPQVGRIACWWLTFPWCFLLQIQAFSHSCYHVVTTIIMHEVIKSAQEEVPWERNLIEIEIYGWTRFYQMAVRFFGKLRESSCTFFFFFFFYPALVYFSPRVQHKHHQNSAQEEIQIAVLTRNKQWVVQLSRDTLNIKVFFFKCRETKHHKQIWLFNIFFIVVVVVVVVIVCILAVFLIFVFGVQRDHQSQRLVTSKWAKKKKNAKMSFQLHRALWNKVVGSAWVMSQRSPLLIFLWLFYLQASQQHKKRVFLRLFTLMHNKSWLFDRAAAILKWFTHTYDQ